MKELAAKRLRLNKLMKSKDQTLLEEAYTKVVEGMINRVEYFEDALKNPMDYELVLNTISDEDWDGNTIYGTVAYIYKNEKNYRDYDRVDTEDDIDQLKDAFEKYNPEGINDQR